MRDLEQTPIHRTSGTHVIALRIYLSFFIYMTEACATQIGIASCPAKCRAFAHPRETVLGQMQAYRLQ
jgi:hypothetical protein